jgi:type I restriction-modification system DNA methylase subunit
MSATSDFSEAFERYRRDIDHASNERQRAQYFIEFLRSLPDLDDEMEERIGYPTDIRPELEEHLTGQKQKPNRELTEWIDGKTTDPGDGEAETVFVDVSGRLDARVGNLVIEFKDDLDADRDDAEEQLREYLFMLHSEGMEEDFLCLATDGERFITYETLLSQPVESDDDVVLNELAHLSMETAEPSQIKRWLSGLLSERVHPVVEELDEVFGVDSETFERSLEILEEAYEESERADVHRQEWADYLTYAHGESPDEQVQLYLRHTYLASFAKLLSYMVFTRGSMPGIDDAKEVLSGEITAPFPENLFEEDLFAWVGRTGAGDEFVELLLDRLLQFNLGRVDQDVFKRLYQDMVSYEVRHDLGEYYTPDWLAEYIVREKMDIEADDSVLDPGCGSGTFLVEALQHKMHLDTSQPDELISRLPQEVVGFDIHPLAVMIAKANYVAAIRDLLPYRREDIQLPVYLADSVLFNDELRDTQNLDGVEVRGPIRVSEQEYYLPQRAIEHPQKFDQSIDIIDGFLDNGSSFEDRLSRNIPEFESVSSAFEQIRHDVAVAAEDGRDSIHTFILKNFFRPLYLSDRDDDDKFDALIGNPPFLSARYMNADQQTEMMDLAREYDLHPGAENVTQMDLATIFVARCTDIYLKDSESLGFVMPRSIFSANHHHPFRRGEMSVDLDLTEVLDLYGEDEDDEGVEPLFNIPASAIIGEGGNELSYPIHKETVSGELDEKNVDLDVASDQLEFESGQIFLHGDERTSWDEVPAMSRSVYYESLLNGATLYPRPLTMAQLDERTTEYGFNANQPPVKTSDHALETTKSYGDADLSANVESEFLYSTLISTDMVPFTHRAYRLSVIPATTTSSGHEIIDQDQAETGGYTGLADWLSQANEHWEGKADRDNINEQLNYRNKVTRQDPSTRYKVLFLAKGKYMTGCVIDLESNVSGDLPIDVNGFIADHNTYYYETDSADEAYYLSAFFNSPLLDEMKRNLQSKGDFDERDIHKSPLEFPIPDFDPDDSDHQRLADLAREGERQANELLPEAEEQYSGIGWIRRSMRDDLSEVRDEIDEIVEGLLSE